MMKLQRRRREAQQNEAEAAAAADGSTEDNEPYVLAVTACPTGIAHTYMARDALKNKLRKWA